MIKVREISFEEYNEFMKKDPALCYIGLDDITLAMLYEKGNMRDNGKSKYHGAFVNELLVTCLRSEEWSELCISCHMYVSTALRGKKISIKIKQEFCKWLKENTKYTKIICLVPETCEHTIAAMHHYGLQLEGRLTNMMKWRMKVVDLLIFAGEI